jgi:gliding motility-associated-like protein
VNCFHRIKSSIQIAILSLLCFSHALFSQVAPPNPNCATAAPFCTGNVMNFPAATQQPPAQAGPNYGCLFSQPNPTWFYMQIANPGPVVITMSANSDIDFICWGPFPNLATACNSLTGNNIQSCSYSPASTETCTIANAIAGQFYMMLITNFSGANQQITFSQTNSVTPGAGTTNCGIVCSVTLTNSGLLCSGNSVTLSAITNTSINSYTLSGPGGVLGTGALANVSNTINSVVNTLTASTVYTVRASNATGTCQATNNVTVIPYPVFTVTPMNPSICQGGSITAGATFSPGTNITLFSYTWSPSPGFGIFNTNALNTIILPPPIATTQSVVVYTLNVSRAAHYCPISQTLALTINNPSTPTLNIPPPMCNTAPAFMLSATPGGGTWSANAAVSGPGSFSPALAAIGTSTLSYAVSVGTCLVSNSATISVSQFITPALSSNPSTLCVQDQPFNLMGIVQNTTNGVWAGPAVSNGFFIPTGLPSGAYPLTYSTQSTPIASVCPASTLYVMNVFNPPVPVISPITAKCNTAPSIILSASPSGGVWAGSGILASGVQNPSQNLIGTNTLTYTAGQGTCVASSTATFHVSQFNTASLTAAIPHQCVSNSAFNLMGIAQSTVNGVWSGVNVVGTYSFNPAGLPTGVYTLTYNTLSSPIPSLCPDVKTISVSVLNPQAPLITQVGPFCNTAPAVQMSVTPATGYWLTNSYLNANGVFTPSNCAPGNNLVQYVIGTPTCNISQGIQISIEAFVPATILGTIPDQCNTNSAVNLLPFTFNTSGSWSGTGVNSGYFYPSTGAGQYVLYYNTASSPSGLCPDQSTVAVRVFSLAPPVITGIGPFCNTAPPVQLQVTPTGGLFGSPVTGLVNAQGLFYPNKGAFGENVLSYSISSGPCVAYAQSTVTIERFVSADFAGYPGPYCRNAFAVNMNSFVKNPGGNWSGPGMVGDMFYPSKANAGKNNVIEYTTFSIPTATLCKDTSKVRIQVNELPLISVVSNTYEGCAPLEVLLNTPSANTGQGQWNLGDGSALQAGLNTSYVYQNPGTYTVSFVYTDEIGCRGDAELSKEIKVYQPPLAAFSAPEQVMISEPVAQLVNLSQELGKNTYVWAVDAVLKSTEVHPKLQFEKAGIYQVQLKATSLEGCVHSAQKTIEVKNDFNAYIPDSFTPNYDGLNDVFKPVFSPYGLDTKTYEMEIFDRWGHSLFYTKDVNTGWNGTVNNQGSQDIKEDVYVYRIKYKDMDGNLYSKMGHVSALR